LSTVAERELLVALLGLTRKAAAARGNLRAAVRVTGEALGLFLRRLSLEGLISEREGLIEASPGQRMGIAVRAVELGADFERVCRALGWLEFEEMAAHVFEENGYEVSRRFRFRAEGRRWEVDLVASRRPLVVCTECKRWSRGMGDSAVRKIVDGHLEKIRVFSESLAGLAEGLGLRGWRRAVAVPLVMSLLPATMRFHRGVPVVSVLQLPSFLSEFEGRLDRLVRFAVELPPTEPGPFQTSLRPG